MERRNHKGLDAKRSRNEPGEASHTLIQYSGPSFSDLPRDILVKILLRLSIKRVFVCKSVCRTWYDLISDPEFAKLHFNQAQVYPLLRTCTYTTLSRMVHLVQPEQDDFELKLDMCDHSHYEPECLCCINVKIDAKFKLPLLNPQMIIDGKDMDGYMLNQDSTTGRKKSIILKMEDHKYHIVNSCNGFLCLSHPFDNDPLVICNPITGEFINLPEVKQVKTHLRGSMACGFGFSPTTKQYKVVRMFISSIQDEITGGYNSVPVTEVHILGTKSWKNIGFFSPSTCWRFPTYLNGYIYWYSPEKPCSVISFDVEKECFGSIPAPAVKESDLLDDVSMGVLGGELCISGALDLDNIDFWALKDYAGKKVWNKIFSIDLLNNDHLYCGTYQPIKYLNDGALLMFHHDTNCLVYKDLRKQRFRYMKVHGTRFKVEATAHIPSFVSLKYALSGQNVEVLNVKSRCAEFQLQEDAEDISLVEEDMEVESDSEVWSCTYVL